MRRKRSALPAKNRTARPLMESLEPRRLLSGGYLDPTFGPGGIATTHFTSGFDTVAGIAVQGDGKIVVAGTAIDGSNRDFLVARYNSDGTVDTGFGTGGKTTIDFAGRSDQAQSLAIDSDGNIIVGGTTTNPSNTSDANFAIARLTDTGALDSSFGSGGKVATDFIGGADNLSTVLADGSSIIAVGSVAANGSLSSDFGLAKYNANGSMDMSFGTAGKVTTDIGTGTVDSAFGAELQGSDIVVAGGTLVLGQKGDFALARYNSNGSLDTGFGSGGKVVTDFGGAGEARAIALDGSKIVAVGRSNVNGSDDFALARYNSNGSLDSTFGTGGKVVTDLFSGSQDYALSVVVDANGRIVVGGSTAVAGQTTHSLFVLAGYTNSGTLDSSFGTGGLTTTDPTQGNNSIESLAIDSHGRILAGGTVYTDFTGTGGAPTASSFALARYSGSEVNPIFATTPISGSSTIRVFDAVTHQPLLTIEPFDGFAGGATVATGDVNGDGIPDIIVGAGAGGSSNIRVFDGKTGQPLAGPLGSFLAFPGTGGNPADPSSDFYKLAFQGPVNVATGDINGDGHDDIIVAVAANGPPHLKVFSGADGSLLMSTLVFPGASNPSDPAYFTNAFQGGVRLAAGDVNNDGRADVIASAGPGADPHVKVFDGATHNEIASFDAYAPAYTGGVRVAAGDYNGDGRDDIIIAPGVGIAPNVKVIDAGNGDTLASFYAYDPGYLGGLWLASTDITGDGKADIFTIPGTGAGPNVKVFAGGTGYQPTAIDSFFAFNSADTAGAYIAAAQPAV